MMAARDEYIAHLKQGVGKHCLVCDQELWGSWTDYNGQIRCRTCGTTYQILGSHLTQEHLDEIGLKKEEVAQRYCDCFDLVPLLRAYWAQTHRQIPFGAYLGRSPISDEDHNAFSRWLYTTVRSGSRSSPTASTGTRSLPTGRKHSRHETPAAHPSPDPRPGPEPSHAGRLPQVRLHGPAGLPGGLQLGQPRAYALHGVCAQLMLKRLPSMLGYVAAVIVMGTIVNLLLLGSVAVLALAWRSLFEMWR